MAVLLLDGMARCDIMARMKQSLTYRDALKILGVEKSGVVKLLDTVATAGLTAWAAGAWAAGADVSTPVTVLELKNEIVRYGHEAVRRVREWRSGLSRFDRSERLIAAHSVLVISAYFEALGETSLPVPIEQLELPGPGKVALATGAGTAPEGYAEMIELLVREPLPSPEAHIPFPETRQRIADCHARLSGRLLSYVLTSSLRNEIEPGRRQRLQNVIEREMIEFVPRRALEIYDDGYRTLAGENTEFLIWAGMTELHALGAGLAEVAALLQTVATRRPGDRALGHLLRQYRAVLAEPIIGTAPATEGVVLPCLADAYLDPICKVSEVVPGDSPAQAEWWQMQRTLPSTAGFLAGYVTSPRAAQFPLVVLGEPGCGKSKLTEVLAARLAEHDFVPVRVELRSVAAESLIVEQIEQAIYRGPGDRASWHDLLEAAQGAQPVVLLDGFDELVQATAINRYDYLEQVRDFQHVQAQIGHPVVVIVTSRTIMADHARFPVGSLALQIQPFSDEQVERWLTIWSSANEAALTQRGLRPLPATIALQHRELAAQPLLLMMLAIYDAGSNALQRATGRLSRAALYESLLTDFAFREVLKSASNRALPAGAVHDLAERELQRLAIVALAIFARGRQSVSESELNRDLPVLFPEQLELAEEASALSPAQHVAGRFFFIHRSEARAHDERARHYEFLHATFAEFLVARLIVRALRELAAIHQMLRRGITASGQVDDGFLYAALSFTCLTASAPTVDFVRELFGQLTPEDTAAIRDLIPELLSSSVYPHPSRSFQNYEPARLSVLRRLAAYSANLVLTMVLLAGTVNAGELFGAWTAASRWSEYGHLWRGMLTIAEWRGLLHAIRVQISRAGELTDITLAVGDGSPVSPTDSIVVTELVPWHETTAFDVLLSAIGVTSYEASIPSATHAGRAFRDAAFTPSWHNSLLLLLAIPFIRATGGDVRRQHEDGTFFLPGYLLALLDFALDAEPEERAALYRHCAAFMSGHAELRDQLLLRLRQDAWKLPPEVFVELLMAVNKAQQGTPEFLDHWQKLVSQQAARTIETANALRRATIGAETGGHSNETGASPIP